jgi:hypothetical protein
MPRLARGMPEGLQPHAAALEQGGELPTAPGDFVHQSEQFERWVRSVRFGWDKLTSVQQWTLSDGEPQQVRRPRGAHPRGRHHPGVLRCYSSAFQENPDVS